MKKTRARLREIQDTDEMNAAMNQLAGVLSAVHQLSDGIDPAEGRAAAGYIGKLNQKAAREEKRNVPDPWPVGEKGRSHGPGNPAGGEGGILWNFRRMRR